MITYVQSTGKLSLNGAFLGDCYSGHGSGLNNPADETIHSMGPIPAGQWKLQNWHDQPHLGPCVVQLLPVGHDAHGRTAFFIHGDNAQMNHTASDGCIIASSAIRDHLRNSGETDLLVSH